MSRPLVSVICLCYNHARFVREALESVMVQTYPAVEIIVVDDGSADNSVEVISEFILEHPQIQFIALPQNIGNCAAFNRALAIAHGAYVVDFATDDVFVAERLEKQVALFESLDDSYGVVFTDVQYIDGESRPFRNHYEYLFSKGLLPYVPQGEVYAAILRYYFVSSPSMLVRRSVLDELGGYDASLAYEDFDFWVRSSRIYKYAFLDERLTLVRRGHRSMSTLLYTQGDRQLESTYRICRKAQVLNRTEEDDKALLWRVRYEFRQAVFSGNYGEAHQFYSLLKELTKPTVADNTLKFIATRRLPLRSLRAIYHLIRFGR